MISVLLRICTQYLCSVHRGYYDSMWVHDTNHIKDMLSPPTDLDKVYLQYNQYLQFEIYHYNLLVISDCMVRLDLQNPIKVVKMVPFDKVGKMVPFDKVGKKADSKTTQSYFNGTSILVFQYRPNKGA